MIEQEDLIKYSEIFKALGHPARLQMALGMLNNDSCNVSDISEKLNMPQSTTSQHLAILKKANIISYTKKGVETCYYVENDYIKSILKQL